MERINIIIDDPAARYGPGVRLTGLSRVQQADGEMEVEGYGFSRQRWNWASTIWFAWWHVSHDASWGYVFDFDNGLRGVSRVCDVNTALRALGARFDPAGPPDPPPQQESEFVRLLREAHEHIGRTLADAVPTIQAPRGRITYGMPYVVPPYRVTPLDEEGAPY